MKFIKFTYIFTFILLMNFGKVFSQNTNPNVVFILIDDLDMAIWPITDT